MSKFGVARQIQTETHGSSKGIIAFGASVGNSVLKEQSQQRTLDDKNKVSTSLY